MKMSGNTIFITGGGSGIGQGLAKAFHALGNKVIIAGRRLAPLQETAAACPGMDVRELDMRDPQSIVDVADWLVMTHPEVNVLINNAGIMSSDKTGGFMDDDLTAATVETNLLGPMRLTSALIEHLKTRPDAVVVNVTSGLAFTPLATSAVYSATKAALHSWTLSLRYRLRGFGAGARSGAALGANRPDGRSRRTARHAARRIFSRDDGEIRRRDAMKFSSIASACCATIPAPMNGLLWRNSTICWRTESSYGPPLGTSPHPGALWPGRKAARSPLRSVAPAALARCLAPC